MIDSRFVFTVGTGLATVVTETMKAGGATIKVERYRITDDGRKALES